MRILLIGAVESSQVVLERLLARGDNVVGVVTAPRSGTNSEWVDLLAVCTAAGIPCLVNADTRSQEVLSWVAAAAPDVILCVGWSRLLGAELLSLPPRGCVGFHPAALPRNRGRHPLIWALVLGLERTASTFFLMDEGADSGPIISQVPIDISELDDARSLYDKILECMRLQLDQVVERVKRCDTLAPQDTSLATYWRKRSAKDGRIDFRMHSRTIFNLVRALTRPYPGATVHFQERDHIVWSCRIVEWADRDVEPGAVLKVEKDFVTVKTTDGAVVLVEHELDPLPAVGDYFS